MIYNLNEIKRVKKYVPQLVEKLEEAYVKYSSGQTSVPPVGYLHFDKPEGNTYIKYGYLHGDDSFVVKIFNGFPENDKLDLPTGDGLIVVFDAKTGMTKAILMDEGWLTMLRTAAASLVCAKHLAPSKIEKIGICGTGTEARACLDLMPNITDCKQVMVYGRTPANVQKFIADFTAKGFTVTAAKDPAEVCANCNLIVTATTTKTPLITADMVKPGTHITALGADADGKNEIDPSVFAKADLVVNDSCSQCFEDGDTSFALKAGTIGKEQIWELGKLIAAKKGRLNDDQITVADLTGIAVQDIVAAELTCRVLQSEK